MKMTTKCVESPDVDNEIECNNQVSVVRQLNGLCTGATKDDTDDEDSQCGIGPWRPPYLRRFADKNCFLAVFCLASMLQGMYYTYFVSVLTTIEKLFQIQSKTTGIIMSATEMGQIGGALLLTYYGGQGHRPRWITCGMLLFAFASFLCSLPHFLYGQQMISNLNLNVNPEAPLQAQVCSAGSLTNNSTTTTGTSTNLCGEYGATSPTTIVLAILFVSLLLIGIGSTAVYTLGIPYIDDNVANRDSPLYFAITIGVRILGPVFGFLLGSACTRLYVNPFEEPLITNKDPRWISAWWLGPFIVAGTLLVVSLAMLTFPRRLPGQRVQMRSSSGANGHAPVAVTTSPNPTNEPNGDGGSDSPLTDPPVTQPEVVVLDNITPSLRSFPVTMRRLLKNQILLFRTASTVLHILPISGIYTFLPKYLESQFRQTAASANMITGTAGVLVMGVGIFASGAYMRLRKTDARFVAAWIAFTALAYSMGMAVLMFIGCPISDFAGLEEGSSGLQFHSPCNLTCQCEDTFAPVCSSEGHMYYSACTAGCKNYTLGEFEGEKLNIYHDCECLASNETARREYCPLNCDNYVWYICIFSLIVLIHSTSEVGSMLLTLRCVDPKDKAMALGLVSFAIGLFGNVPCPIIYGAVVDSACIIWEYTCGQQGACWFYDPSVFRMFFHGMTSAIMFLAFLVDVVVWYKARSIRFSDDELPRTEAEAQPMYSVCSQCETTV